MKRHRSPEALARIYAGFRSAYIHDPITQTEPATTGNTGSAAVPCCLKCKGHTVRTSSTTRFCQKCERTWSITFSPNSDQWTVSAI